MRDDRSGVLPHHPLSFSSLIQPPVAKAGRSRSRVEKQMCRAQRERKTLQDRIPGALFLPLARPPSHPSSFSLSSNRTQPYRTWYTSRLSRPPSNSTPPTPHRTSALLTVFPTPSVLTLLLMLCSGDFSRNRRCSPFPKNLPTQPISWMQRGTPSMLRCQTKEIQGPSQNGVTVRGRDLGAKKPIVHLGDRGSERKGKQVFSCFPRRCKDREAKQKR